MAAKAATTTQAPAPAKDHAAVLEGWGLPRFPEGIDLLQAVYDSPSLTRHWLGRAARQVNGFPLKETRDYPRTEDGHVWEVAYFYNLPNGGEAGVLFAKVGGLGNKVRHCAVHVRGAGPGEIKDLERLVNELGQSIED